MSVFSDNLKVLRSRKGFSQAKLAADLIITRERLAKYEDGRSEPPFDILKRISHYFHVSIDILISVDLSKVPMEELLKMGDNRILLPITVDSTGKDNIEIIPHKARAGYLSGYSDPEFIENLQHISLPFLKNGKFRAFPIQGDSMPPLREGSFIIGRYMESLKDIKDGSTCVLLTRNEGIVYKRVFRNGKSSLMLHSDNSVYAPYEVGAEDILEIWEFACSLSTVEFESGEVNAETLKDMIRELRREVHEIKEKVK